MKQDLYSYIFNKIDIPQKSAVLDVGCKNAGTLKLMKERFNLTGRLIGIDKQDKHFENGQTQSDLAVQLIKMNASDMFNFSDETFDFIFHKDTLECITDIESHICELHRILKPQGTVICIHRDWESIVFNGRNKNLINKAVYGYANFLQDGWMDDCDGWIGRRIYGYFNKTGLFAGTADCYNQIETEFVEGTWGYSYMHEMHYFTGENGFLTNTGYEELISDMTDCYRNGEYLCSNPFYIYIGRKLK